MTTLSTIGGNGESIKIIVGENIESLLKTRKFEWETYETNNNSTFLIKTVNEIFNFPEYIDKEDDIILILDDLFEKSPVEILNALIRSFIIYEPLNYAYKNLFWKIKEFIENLIILSYPEKEIKKKLLEWEKYVLDTDTDTSSVILWALYNKQSPFYRENFKYSRSKFKYIGYCPYEPAERICALLQFPLDDYEKYVEEKIKLVKFHSKIDRILSIEELCDNKLSDELSNKSNFNYHMISKTEDNSTNTDIIKKYVEQWLELAEKMKPFLKEKEKEYIFLARTLNLAANEFETQTKIIMKSLLI